MFQIPYFRFQISHIRFSHSYSRFQISDFIIQISDFRIKISGFRFEIIMACWHQCWNSKTWVAITSQRQQTKAKDLMSEIRKPEFRCGNGQDLVRVALWRKPHWSTHHGRKLCFTGSLRKHNYNSVDRTTPAQGPLSGAHCYANRLCSTV